jgi:hypothetical protein
VCLLYVVIFRVGAGPRSRREGKHRAEIYDRRSGKKIRKTFHNYTEAKGWRHDAASDLRKGTLSTPRGVRNPVWRVRGCVSVADATVESASSDSGKGGVCLVVSLLYLLFRRTLAVVALRFRSSECKELEIVVLRHELAVLQRQIVGRGWTRVTGYSWLQPASY